MSLREDRAHRTPSQRQDHAVQPPHRLQRGHLALRGRARRAARGRGPRARRTRGSPERAVQAEEDHLRVVRGGGSGGHRQGRARRARRAGVPRAPTRSCTWCAPSTTRRCGAPDPRRDIVDLEMEVLLADLEVVDRRLERLEVSLRKRRTDAEAAEQAVLQRLKDELEREVPLRAAALTPEEARIIRGFTFLSEKPILHCVNLHEKGIGRRPSRGGYLRPGRPGRAPRDAGGLGVRGDRGRGGAARRRGARGLPGRPRPERAGHQPRAPRLLRAARPRSRSSPSGRTRSGPGPSGAARAPRTRRAPSTPTSRAASSAPRSTRTTSWSAPRAPSPSCAPRASYGWKARTTSSRTGRSATSASTSASSAAPRVSHLDEPGGLGAAA